MSGRVIAIVNQKGGSGKTTTAQMLAAALTLFHGKRVLAIDADAQGSLTIAAGIEGNELDLSDAVGGAPLNQVVITEVGSGYDLLPGGDSSAILERNLHGLGNLTSLIDEARATYDYVIIDCAPSLSVLTLNAIAAADEVIIASIPHYLNIAGVEKMLDTLDALQNQGLGVERARLLFTQTDSTNLAKETIEATRETYPDVFGTVIRRNIALAAAQSDGLDIYEYQKASNGAKDYRALADEIVNG